MNLKAELFDRDQSVIFKRIKNTFKEKELTPDPVVTKFATTAEDIKARAASR